MGRTAFRKTKKDSPATEPASSSTAIPQAADENEDEETAASLSSVLEGLHVGLADWLMYSATQEQRATVVRASNMVRDSPTPQNEAKATEILYRVIGDAGIFGQLYRHHAKNPLDLLRVLASKTVQNYPEVLSGLAGRNGDEAIPAPPANSTLAGADSQPSGAPCSCSRCKGRQRFSEDDEPEGFFCAADLILSQRDEIKLVKAYNAQFGRRASKPPPSRCQKLLAKARTRRADDGRASHVETSLCFFGMRKPFSSTPLHKLSPIRIKEMEVPRIHSGRYLLCRIISRPVSRQCLSFVIEDQDGRAEEICIFNHPVKGLESSTPATYSTSYYRSAKLSSFANPSLSELCAEIRP